MTTKLYKQLAIATFNSKLQTQVHLFIRNRLQAINNSELTPSQGNLLDLVYLNGGKVQIKALYDTMIKPKTTITEMIKRLVQLGYLTKETSKNDKRISYVIATPKTQALKKDFQRISDELFEKFFSGFKESEKNDLVRLLAKAIKNFE